MAWRPGGLDKSTKASYSYSVLWLKLLRRREWSTQVLYLSQMAASLEILHCLEFADPAPADRARGQVK